MNENEKAMNGRAADSRKGGFYNDAVSNYLIIRCPQQALEGYQYRMLAANRIEGILSCSMRTIDGETSLYYDVTGCESLSAETGSSVISGGELKRFLYSMSSMLESLSDYLLDDSHLLLGPEYIFHDYEKDRWCFTYYPEAQWEGGMRKLFEYLADRVDAADPETSAVIYQLCDMAGKPGFVLRKELLDCEYEMADGEKAADAGGYTATEGGHKTITEVEPESPDRRIPGRKCYEGDHKVLEENCSETDCSSWKSDRTGCTDSAGSGSQKRSSSGGILALAVFFLAGAAGMEVSRYLVVMTEEQQTAVHAGMIAFLAMALGTALYGTLFTYRRNQREIRDEENEEKEKKRNAMAPSVEFDCGIMKETDSSYQTERR